MTGVGRRLTNEEGFEEEGGSDINVAFVTASFAFDNTDCKFGAGSSEEYQRNDLENKTCQHDVLANIAACPGVRRGSDATTKTL